MASPAYLVMARGVPDKAAWLVLTDVLGRDPWARDILVARRNIALSAKGNEGEF